MEPFIDVASLEESGYKVRPGMDGPAGNVEDYSQSEPEVSTTTVLPLVY